MRPNYQRKKTQHSHQIIEKKTHITNHGEIIKNVEKSQLKTKQIE